MKKIINLNLYKKYRLQNRYKKILTIEKNNEYIFFLDEVKTIIGPTRFIRENEEFKFEMNIKEKTSTYLLKEKNMLVDIDVEKLSYKTNNNNIILEYKLSSDDEIFKIEINVEDDIDE